jgi:hypothetical protein
MAVSPQEPYFCSGTLCQPTLQPEGNGICHRSPYDCVKSSGYELPTKYCASTGCSAVPADYVKPSENDVCTASRHTCYYASKHKHATGFLPDIN